MFTNWFARVSKLNPVKELPSAIVGASENERGALFEAPMHSRPVEHHHDAFS